MYWSRRVCLTRKGEPSSFQLQVPCTCTKSDVVNYNHRISFFLACGVHVLVPTVETLNARIDAPSEAAILDLPLFLIFTTSSLSSIVTLSPPDDVS